MTEENLEIANRQRRVRRLAGLVVGGALVTGVAFALPAMASQGTSTAQSAATITTASSTSSSSPALEAAVPTTEPTTTTAPEETTTTTTPPSPEEELRAKIAAMTPEEAAAFKAYVTPPPPTTTTTAPKPVPTTTAPKPAAAPKPQATQAQSSGPANGFLACVRQRESKGQYGINTGNGYYGAYQFSQSTWNNTASHAGRGDLVGRAPSSVSPAEQDAMAAHLYGWQGRSPWAGPGC